MRDFKINFYILAISFIALCLSLQVKGAVWAGGDGTEGNPYQIESIEQLKQLSEDSNNGEYHDGEFFILTKDIVHNKSLKIPYEIEDFDDIPDGEIWETIEVFNGTLDGAGHSITGLLGDAYALVVGPYLWTVYFIHTLNGVIRNLTIKDSILCSWVGHGDLENSKIENCINYAVTRFGFCSGAINEIFGCGNYGVSYSCGIARGPVSSAINCYNYGEIITKYRHQGDYVMTYQDRGAGLFYIAYSVLNCMNNATVEGSDDISGICWTLEDRKGNEKFSNIVNYGQVVCNDGYYPSAIAFNFKYNYQTVDHKTRVSNLFSLCDRAYELIGNDDNVVFEGMNGFLSEEFMKSDVFLSLLNDKAKSLESRCCGWKKGKDGYPILEIINDEPAGIPELSIKEKEQANCPVYFYNLQGIEIKNLQKGIYIKIQGNHIEKVFY